MVKDNQDHSLESINWVSTQKQKRFKQSDNLITRPKFTQFWSEAPLFQNSMEFETEHINKFLIQKIENIENGKKILYGNRQMAIIEGLYAETNFVIGQTVTVLPCLCCIDTNENSISNLQLDKACNNINTQYRTAKYGDSNANTFSESNRHAIFYVNDQNNSIIIEDDALTVTSFCTSLDCINNSLIKSHIADFSFDYGHPALVVGIIVHKLIQTALMAKRSTFEYLTNEAKKIIKLNIIGLYSCNISEKEALNEILKNMKNIVKFLKNGYNVEKVEHRVYSQVYGLKGSIDCLDTDFVIEIKTGKSMSVQHRSQVILYTILLKEEVIKGEMSDYRQFLCDASLMENQALALDDFHKNDDMHYNRRQCKPVLYYVKPGDIVNIKMYHEECVNLLKIRNDIACNKEITECECSENSICSILNKIKNLNCDHWLRKQYEAIELEAKADKKYIRCLKVVQNGHKVVLQAKEAISFGEHCYLYTLNKKYITSGVIEVSENEKITVELFDSMDLDSYLLVSMDNDSNFLRFMRWSLVQVAYYKYLMKNNTISGKGIDSFMLPGQVYGLDVESIADSLDNIELNTLDSFDVNSGFSLSDISNEYEDNRVNVKKCNKIDTACKKYIDKSDTSKITIELTRKESINSVLEIENGNQQINYKSEENDIKKEIESWECSSIDNLSTILDSTNSSVEYSDISAISNASLHTKKHTDNKNEIIKDSVESTHINSSRNTVKNVLTSLEMKKPNVLFNDFDATNSFPYFTVQSKSSFGSFKYHIPDVFKNEFIRLNEDQRNALFISLNCESYRIIHGMPGTGKSTLIALLIRILIFYEQKVLLICYTHLAIDNVIKKLGSINYYRAKKESLNFNTFEEAQKKFNKVDLVVGSCYSFHDPVFIKKQFDYCIVDEGSQIHLLLCLIPISISKRFCIVGDHLQLKPLCKTNNALSLSLFEYLLDNCSVLTHQYRMGDAIMRLSNSLFYNHKLVGFGASSTVSFIDIESINLTDYIKNLKKEVVLCYFNAKVREIQNLNKAIVCTTIDKYQGSEADEIVVIFDPLERCNVLESRERLNVALTRAKKALYLVGNRKEMQKIDIFRHLLELL